MSDKTTCPNYETIVAVLLGTELADITPAKIHGAICAIICFYPGITAQQCLELILARDSDTLAQEKYMDLLSDLFDYSWQNIQGMDFGFRLLLPDDDEPIAARVEALAQLSEGFSQTHKLCLQAEDEVELSEEVTETINNLQDIATVYADDEEQLIEEDDQERAYNELMEYVRLAILMVFAEMIEDKKTVEEDISDSDIIH